MKYPVKIAASLLLASAFWSCQKTPATSKAAPKEFTIAFYNLENLFDTEDDPAIDDQEFLPGSDLQWTPDRYKQKLTNMASVIDKLGDEDGPELLGVCEIENRRVLEDLIQQPVLASRTYDIIHFNSPDLRGIDVALLFKPSAFRPLSQQSIPVRLPNPNEKTRDILKVTGILYTDTVTVLVNHWPSKRGGAEESDPKRIAAAEAARAVVDQELIRNPEAKVLLMGDFNDTPDSKAIKSILNTGSTPSTGMDRQLFNPFAQLAEEKKGSYYYKNAWDMIDQMMLTRGWLTGKNLQYVPNSATIYKTETIQEKEGKYQGAPFRTYAGKKYLGGYSDHFPVFITVTTR